jgi:hypothetical protein
VHRVSYSIVGFQRRLLLRQRPFSRGLRSRRLHAVVNSNAVVDTRREGTRLPIPQKGRGSSRHHARLDVPGASAFMTHSPLLPRRPLLRVQHASGIRVPPGGNPSHYTASASSYPELLRVLHPQSQSTVLARQAIPLPHRAVLPNFMEVPLPQLPLRGNNSHPPRPPWPEKETSLEDGYCPAPSLLASKRHPPLADSTRSLAAVSPAARYSAGLLRHARGVPGSRQTQAQPHRSRRLRSRCRNRRNC